MRTFVATSCAVAFAALSLLGAVSPALGAAGGNSADAKACQKGAWEHRHDEAGNPFENAGACVSYGAQGGTIGFPLPMCVDSTTPSFTDVELVAAIDSHENANQYISDDGTCSGQLILAGFTIVQAANQKTADTMCATIEGTGSFAVGNMQKSFGYATPSDWWPCSLPSATTP